MSNSSKQKQQSTMAMQHNVKIGCVLPDNANAMPKLLEVHKV